MIPSRRSLRQGAWGLSTKVALALTAGLLVLLIVMEMAVVAQLRTQMLSQRRDAILEDAAVRFSQAQSLFDRSAASTTDQVQELVSQAVVVTRDSAAGAGAVGVGILRSPESSEAFVINQYVNPQVDELVSQSLRERVESGEPSWQSVGIRSANGDITPGILVGALVEVPRAGAYEMFILYSLKAEQDTLRLAVRILGITTVPLVIVVAGATFWLIRRMLSPVRVTAAAAQKLAEGDLDTRVEVHGDDEMARMGTAFNDMADSLQQQIAQYQTLAQLQQRFVSDVSHELRTPMTTIRMAEELIFDERQALPGAASRSAELLHSETQRMEEMLFDLLEISRYDAQAANVVTEPTDLFALTEKTIAATKELADRLGIEVHLYPRPTIPTAEVDSRRIERVIRNLLVNAYEHADGSPVEVEVRSTKTCVGIRVVDRGVGIDSTQVERVFDRFFRADPSRARTTGGSGLGLAIAKEDVLAHDGCIEVESVLGEGTAFIVLLPRHSAVPIQANPFAPVFDSGFVRVCNADFGK